MNTAGTTSMKIKHCQGGFAIIEGLIAIAVFAIAMLAVVSMQTKSVFTNDVALGITEQSTMAADMVEQLMALPYTDARLADGAHAPIIQGRYTMSWTVDEEAMIDNTKTISVTVTWNEQGTQKSINLLYVKPDTI
jgi:Tfp pilus assembly protein PilV